MILPYYKSIRIYKEAHYKFKTKDRYDRNMTRILKCPCFVNNGIMSISEHKIQYLEREHQNKHSFPELSKSRCKMTHE